MKQQRCIYLRGIKVKDIRNGNPESLSAFIKLRSKTSNAVFSYNIGVNNSNPIYKTEGNKSTLYVTTNSFVISSKVCSQTLCAWCRLPINHRGDDIVGVPLIASTIEIREKHLCLAKTFVCWWGCCLAFLENEVNTDTWKRIEYVKNKYRRLTGKTLLASPCWRLLEDNGGSIPRKLYFCNKYQYINTGEIRWHPIKEVYQVSKI